MISSILVLAAFAAGAAAETFSGVASFNPTWTGGLACGGDYDKSKFLLAMGKAKFGDMVNGNTSPVCGHTITVNYKGNSLVATIVDKMMNPRVNGIDLSESAFIELNGDLGAGLLDVTWSWNDGFDPATGTQSMAGLKAVALNGQAGGISDGSAPAATSSVATAASSVVTSEAAGTSALASDTALAAGADAAATSSTAGAVASVDASASPVAPVASVDTSANAVVPAASSSASSTSTSEPAPAGNTGRPAGYGGHRADKQRRCAAQL